MEIIYSPQGPPQIIRSHTHDSEDNHSIFDFPINNPTSNDHYNEDDSSHGKKLSSKSTTKYVGKGGSSTNKPKRKKKSKKKVDPPFSPPYSTNDNNLSPHPYPSSISIQLNSNNPNSSTNNTNSADSPPRATSKTNELRSPTTSPGEIRQNPTIDSPRGDNELRQSPTRSPTDPATSPNYNPADPSGFDSDYGGGESSAMSKHHSLALSQFKTNQLSNAVSSYTTAIQYGLDELISRKDMIKLQLSDDKRDSKVISLAMQLAQVHLDLAKTLEIANKYQESNIELNNGLGLLLYTCQLSQFDDKVKEIKRDISRMERAMNVDIEREKLVNKLDEKMKQLQSSSTGSGKGNNKEQLYKSATSTIKKLLRLERNSNGEQSYIYAKLLLKLSKLKVQFNNNDMSNSNNGTVEMESNLNEAIKDTIQAVGIMKQVLDKEHTLVGIACTFLGSLFDKKLDLFESAKAGTSGGMGGKGLNSSGIGGGRNSTIEVSRGSEGERALTKEEKELITKTIGMYTDSLAPLKFKYAQSNNNNNEGSRLSRDEHNEGNTLVQPDIAEVYHKIAKLYTKLCSGDSSSSSSSTKVGSYSSNQDMAIEAYHKSLQFYGITSINRDDISKKQHKSSMYDVHPNAITVWYDLSTHYLLNKQYNDCVYTSEKCIELYKKIMESRYKFAFGSSSGGMEKLERLVVSAYTLAGDGYVKLHRYDDAGRCYSEGYYEYKQLTFSSSSSNSSDKSGLSNTDGSLILQKLGMSYYSRGKLNDAKSYLIDALHTLRSTDNGGGGSEGKTIQMARLLSDIGTVQIKKNEVSEAKKTLRSCLKIYADIGYSDHCDEVEKVRSMYNELQRGVPTSSSSLVSTSNSAMYSPSRHTTTASVSTGIQSANTPAASTTTMSFMATPRSNATSLTHPSTNYSRSTRSSGSGSGGLIRSIHSTTNNNQQQLQTLMEVPPIISRQASEFTVVASNGTKTVLSPMHCSHHGGGDGSTSTLLHKLINTDPHDMNKLDRKSGGSKEASPSSFDVQLLKTQLEQYQQRIKQVEDERDQEKKERILSNTTHRKEIEAASQSVMKNTVMEAELKQLRKEVHVSETSYQELVKAIDDEKERLTNVHETKVQELQVEIEKLQNRLKYAGGIENVRLSEELVSKKKEIIHLKEQSQKAQQEVTSLQATVRTLKSEKETVTMNASSLKTKNDQLQSEVQRLSSELASAKAQRVYNSMPQAHANPNSMEIKKLEFELQSERNRRMILEASLQKEYDRSSNNNNGGYGFPMMPFGYPMMQMGGGQPDNNTVAKMKTLEIDLATEKAGKEMLNNVITELRSTHEQEKESMQAQYSSFLTSHEEECSDLMSQIAEKRAGVEILTNEVATIKSDKSTLVRQLDDTMNELSDIKGRLMQTSHELSSAMEEKIILSNTVSSLERTEGELVKTREDLSLIKAELKDEKESLRRMESEGSYLREDNDRIKKEYNEAIQMFESEIDKVKCDRNDVEKKLETAKEHLHNVMQELEAAHTDSRHFKVALDNTHKDVQSKSEQLRQARRQVKELTESCTELESKVSKLEEIASSEQKARADKECDLEETQGKLSVAEESVEELNEAVAGLTSSKAALESRLSVVEDLHERLDAVLSPIPQQLEAVLPDLNSIVPSTRDAPDGEQQANPTPESLGRRVSNLLHHISAYNKELHEVIKTRDDTLDKTEWNLSNTTKDLDKLEVKHKELKEELAEMGFLQADYDELLEQYELVVEDKERLDEYLKAIESDQETAANKNLIKAQEERDLFESRLKEAVDDLEELESERDAALVELTQARTEFTEKEASLGVRISALETDNKLIETLETQALEYDAALSQKDDKMSKLVEELELAQAELSEIKTKLAKDGVYPEFTKMFPDVELPQDDTVQEPQELTLSQLATNPFAYDDLSEDESDKEDDKPVNPFDDALVEGGLHQAVPQDQEKESNTEEDSPISDYQEETVQLQARVAELEATIECLNKHIMDTKNEQVSSTDSVDEIAMSRETDEIDMVRQQEAMVEEVEALKEYIQRLEESNEALTAQLEQSRDDLDAALLSDDEVMTSLREELEGWKNQIVELQLSNDTLKKKMVNKCNTQSDTDSLVEEITSLEHQVQTLEEHNLALSTRLEEAANNQVNQDEQDALTQEIVVLKDEIKALNSSQDELTSQLAESEVKAKEASRLHEEYISSIKEEAGLYDKLQYALDEKDATHKSELEVLNRKLSEMSSQTSSQDDHEDKMIQHNLELATVNAEFHNAMMSMDELTQENLKLKEEINALASKESGEDRNFEEEMNKAHVRFESMERALHDKVTRLEKEKDKLVADFNEEIVKQEDEHTKTKIELSAWKLEMQNALNDIELLKKERDELKAQLKAYTI